MACSKCVLPRPDAAVKKERVVRFAGRLRDGQRGGVGEIVVVADDERFESVLGIEMQIRAWRCFGLRLAPAVLAFGRRR